MQSRVNDVSELFNEIKEILTMQQVARHLGYEPNRSGFIHSPFSTDKTASCKLYHDSFYDFSTRTGGDLIRFTALVLGCDNWQAAQYLIENFALPISMSGHGLCREEVERRQRERQTQQERKQEFRAALLKEIDELKRWEAVCQKAIEEKIYPPFSEEWVYVTSELQKTSRRLDILCCTDTAYFRMKSDEGKGLSSDRPQWLLDVLSILAKDGVFQVTEYEIVKIKRQRDFELNRRPENRGEVKRTKWQENLQQMSNDDLIALLENLIGAI